MKTRYFSLSVALAALLAAGSAGASFLLEPPVTLLHSRGPRLAVSDDGQRVLVTWSTSADVVFVTSIDGGDTFLPTRTVLRATGGLFYQVAPGLPLVSSDATKAFVMTGPLFRANHTSWIRAKLYVELTPAQLFQEGQSITAVSDACQYGGLLCATLRDFDLAAGDAAATFAAAWNAYQFDGPEQSDIWLATSVAGVPQFGSATNLSRLLLPSALGNDYDPRVASDAAGSRLFVSWTEIPPVRNFQVHLATSLDGGATWSLSGTANDAWYNSDVDYARDAGRVVWAYNTGFYFIRDEPSVIVTQLSDDDGTTLTPPVVVASRRDLPGGDTIQVTEPVRAAISRDGRTIAVMHAEEFCDAALGCTGGTDPFATVLSVSEDGGATYQRLGAVAYSFFADFDLGISSDGNTIYVAAGTAHDETYFIRAVRQ